MVAYDPGVGQIIINPLFCGGGRFILLLLLIIIKKKIN